MVFLSWLLRLVELAKQRCNGRIFCTEVSISTGAGKKKPEDMFCHVKLGGQKGFDISLGVWGRPKGGIRGDLQVPAYMVTFTEGMNIGKGIKLGRKVIEMGIC